MSLGILTFGAVTSKSSLLSNKLLTLPTELVQRLALELRLLHSWFLQSFEFANLLTPTNSFLTKSRVFSEDTFVSFGYVRMMAILFGCWSLCLCATAAHVGPAACSSHCGCSSTLISRRMALMISCLSSIRPSLKAWFLLILLITVFMPLIPSWKLFQTGSVHLFCLSPNSFQGFKVVAHLFKAVDVLFHFFNFFFASLWWVLSAGPSVGYAVVLLTPVSVS